METKTMLLLIVCGAVIALLCTLYSQDMTVGMGASITGYGLPLLWLKKVTIVYPGSPEEYSLYDNGVPLLADIVFWVIIVTVVYFVYKQVRKHPATN
ncbi:MAG: hypothetical protein WC325_06435 [Candidatus Bathyarchaeia archaeon]|jgi:hypothetical protein